MNKQTAPRKRFTYASGDTPLTGYTIKRGIGIGGFGEVYFAVSDAGKEVALKRIQRNLDVELRGVKQCLNLNHVNLITLWDIAHDEHDQGWVVMEYVPGESLREVVERNPDGMPLGLVEKWFTAITRGVAHLHRHGIVHRDLKPGNIFHDLDQDIIKIGDYGLSKFISCSRRSGQTESVGTFHYMAPEIGKGVYGKEIDTYALGIILCETLTGDVPFDGESTQEIIMKHLTADPDLGAVEQPFRRVIKKALAKDPGHRYAHVEEMMADLPFGDADVLSMQSAEVSENANSVWDDGPELTDSEIEEKDTDVPPSKSNPDLATSGRVPPVQSLLLNEIEPFYIGDDQKEIVLGDVQEVVEAETIYPQQNSHAGVYQPSVHPSQAVSPSASTVYSQHARKSKLADFWNHHKLNVPVKLVLIILGWLMLLSAPSSLLPVSITLGVLYLLFFLVRRMSQPAMPASTSGTSMQLDQKQLSEIIGERLRQALRLQTAAERASDLTGSLLVSAGVVAVFTALASVAFGTAEIESQTWAFYTWLGLSAVSASWTILIISKFWETQNGDSFLRRATLMSIGLVIGVTSLVISQFLLVDLSRLFTSAGSIELPKGPMTDSSGSPALPAFVAFFGALFLAIGWWKQSDPLRRTRLSLFAVGIVFICSTLIGAAFHFPTAWSVALGVTISIAVQLASPWMQPQQRMHLQQERSSEI